MIKKSKDKRKIITVVTLLAICLSSIPLSSAAPTLSDCDINNDGIITTLDLIEMSNHIGMTGAPGWVAEDVDNNGIVQVCDLMIVASHYGETTTTTSGKSYYVATSGSDSNSGTASSPFATVSKAISASSSGTTIYLREEHTGIH
jgi:hypothetical protein